MSAWRDRALLGALAGGSLLVAHALWREPAARAEALYVFVLALGYGHLLGAAWLGWPRLRARRPRSVPAPLFGLWLVSGAGAALAVYAAALEHAPWLPLLLLGISVWHTVENDVALFRHGRLAHTAPPALREPAARALAWAWTLALGSWALETPTWREASFAAAGPDAALLLRCGAGLAAVAALRGGPATRLGGAAAGTLAVLPAPPLALVDLFAATTLYHLYTWLAVQGRRLAVLRRAGAHEPRRRLRRRLVAIHALPAAACLAVAFAPGERLETLRPWLLGPGLYLFWSALHVLQTDWLRRVPATDPAAAGPASPRQP